MTIEEMSVGLAKRRMRTLEERVAKLKGYLGAALKEGEADIAERLENIIADDELLMSELQEVIDGRN